MRRQRSAIVALAVMSLTTAACIDQNQGGGGTPPPPVGTTTRLATGGTISSAAISRNGRYVAFVSTASTPGTDGNGSATDVFVIDRTTSVTSRVSGGNAASDSPSVADDGSVVFLSASTNLGVAGTHGRVDAYRWTSSGGVARITDSPGDVFAPLVSANGATVVFGAPETLVLPTGSSRTQTYRWQPANPSVFAPVAAVGTDGSTPVAVGPAGDRVLLAEPGRLSLFDAAGPTTTLVASATASPAAPRATSFSVAPHAVADDGDVTFAEVTYSFDASSGVASFESGNARRWDRQTATLSPLATSGVPGGPVQSANGRHVVYADLTAVSVDQDLGSAYLRGTIRSLDTTNGTNTVVAVASQASFGTVSGDGRYVAFVSTDPSLVPPSPGTEPSLYLWDRGA